jgi:uncharacterized Ntn-hydrolase superfamily protein
VGAVCTQALVNPHYGPAGLDLVSEGVSPPDALRRLTGEDDGKDHRQVHLIDVQGRIAAHTGRACIDWCGHLAGAGWSVASLANRSAFSLAVFSRTARASDS